MNIDNSNGSYNSDDDGDSAALRALDMLETVPGLNDQRIRKRGGLRAMIPKFPSLRSLTFKCAITIALQAKPESFGLIKS
ncbi:hypothetical protein BGZ83_003893 [Gryganskiella cystojenkinii]|nr:hypothetical protein BGZ83_003893 [Gryganskiella cystojenkinii]